jgi:5-methyltetrahydrofolate--homocysteine methyltransferase
MAALDLASHTILHELLADRGTLVIDGATGTELFARGLEAGDAPERMNLERHEAVHGLHQAYVDAGSDIILTNTFGGSAYRLMLHGLQDQVVEINREAARHARAIVDAAGKRIVVAGSIGPTGELLVPLGTLQPDDAATAFAEQAQGLTEGGADVLWIETMSSLEEAEAAVLGAQSRSSLPVCVTLSFDTAGRTMMGVTGTDAGKRLADLGVVAIGANCGNNLADTEAAVAEIKAAAPDVLIISKANAGVPQWHGAELVYSGTPEVMAAHAHRMREAGIAIIGGCCGNTPEHIRAIRGVIDGTIEVPEVDRELPTVRVEPGNAQGGRRRRRRRG